MIGVVDQYTVLGFGESGTLSLDGYSWSLYGSINATSFSVTGGQIFIGINQQVLMARYSRGIAAPVLGLNTSILREADFSSGGAGYYQSGATSVLFEA